jgi:hypothetical protein
LLLPFLAALLVSFYNQILAIGNPKEKWLLYGTGLFVAVYLFVYNFKEVYEFGQNVVTKLLAFAKPIVNPAALVIPIYAVIFSIAYLILNAMNVLGKYEFIAVMTISFFWTMHVVLTAEQLRGEEKAAIKGGYFFGFSLALIFHVIIAALLLAMVMDEFLLVNFFKHLSGQTVDVYHSIYKLLFVPS